MVVLKGRGEKRKGVGERETLFWQQREDCIIKWPERKHVRSEMGKSAQGELCCQVCAFGSFPRFPNKQGKHLTLSGPLGRMTTYLFAGEKSWFLLKMSQNIACHFTPGWDDKCMVAIPSGGIHEYTKIFVP